ALRQRRAIPRSVEGDEGAAAIARRKLVAEIDRERIGRPVTREIRDRSSPLRAEPDGLPAIAAIFRREHKLFLVLVVLASRPAIVGALADLDQLLGRKLRALLGRVEA